MRAAAQAEAQHTRSLLDLSQHQSRAHSISGSTSQGSSTSQTQSFQAMDSLVDRFARDHSLSKEDATQLLAKASASANLSLGYKNLGATLGGELSGQASRSTTERETLSAAEDFAKQKQFQEALTSSEHAARDLRESDLTDEGKRYVKSLNESSERSGSLRQEASQSLQRSQSLLNMASFTQQNAASINASLNQEYVNWLQTQSLPQTQGPMGITEAETILSSRPDLDHAYQRRFLEEKMGAGIGPESSPFFSGQYGRSGFSEAQAKSQPSREIGPHVGLETGNLPVFEKGVSGLEPHGPQGLRSPIPRTEGGLQRVPRGEGVRSFPESFPENTSPNLAGDFAAQSLETQAQSLGFSENFKGGSSLKEEVEHALIAGDASLEEFQESLQSAGKSQTNAIHTHLRKDP